VSGTLPSCTRWSILAGIYLWHPVLEIEDGDVWAGVCAEAIYIGSDTDARQLAAARENVGQAGLQRRVTLMPADARHLPFRTAGVDAIISDLPFGKKHARNGTLYHLHVTIIMIRNNLG
jgi:23S rRNA G2445 N2-methylase RlmL